MALSYSEYWSQEDPQRNVKVRLEEKDYKLGLENTHLSLFPFKKTTQVFIQNVPPPYEKYNGTEYIVYDGSGTLWSTDRHGNPKSPSCFFIPYSNSN